jgi:tol-pal system protein YbgF
MKLKILSASFLAWVALCGAAHAQGYSPEAEDRIRRLETQLNILERETYKGGGANSSQSPMQNTEIPVVTTQPPISQAAEIPAPQNNNEGGLIVPPAVNQAQYTGVQDSASLLARLQSVEERMNGLNGRIETLEFKANEAIAQLSRMKQDVDFALNKMSGGQPSNGATIESSPVPLANSTIAPAPVDPNSPASTAKNKTGILGTVPAGSASAEPTMSEDPKALYDQGYVLVVADRNKEARKVFENFIQKNPKHKLADNAHYWLAETYYAENDYKSASIKFLDAYKKFPAGEKAPDSLLKLGISLGKQSRKSDACVTFDKLKKDFPKASGTIQERTKKERKELGC